MKSNLHEGFLSRMQSFVSGQLSGLSVTFRTVAALVRFQAGMFRHVRFQRRMRSKALRTEWTFVFVDT